MSIGILLHQSDLRTNWNPALSAAAKENTKVLPVFIYDPDLEVLGAASRWWLEQSLKSLELEYKKLGNTLLVRKGNLVQILSELAKKTNAGTIYFNTRFEPRAYKAQKKVVGRFNCKVFNGNHLVDPREIEVRPGVPYKVFTPFYKAALKEMAIGPRPSLPKKIAGVAGFSGDLLFKKEKWAQKLEKHWQPGRDGGLKRLRKFISSNVRTYARDRDFPDIQGTSKLSAHLHFGEVSPYEVWELAQQSEVFRKQLIWREFSTYFLFHFPDVLKNNWSAKFDAFEWNKSTAQYEKWKKGETGYPIVDAAMKQLWDTGWMHNRLRMVAASFLTKDLLLHWTAGERWFWDTLVDADKANNIMGWQWTAGTGPDAAPYFRVFNPILQGEKFDPQGEFVKTYLPELAKLPQKWIHQPWNAPEEVLEQAGVVLGKTYPKPMVDHKEARKEALKRFNKIK